MDTAIDVSIYTYLYNYIGMIEQPMSFMEMLGSFFHVVYFDAFVLTLLCCRCVELVCSSVILLILKLIQNRSTLLEVSSG